MLTPNEKVGKNAWNAVAYFDAVVSLVLDADGDGTLLGAMQRGYFDESGTHADSRVTTVAGFVSGPKEWRRLLPLWQNALSTEGEGLRCFHANEFGHYAHQRRWDESRRNAFLVKLADLIIDNLWMGFSGSVVTSDYESLPLWVRRKIGGRYHFCFAAMMHLLRKRIEFGVTTHPMALIFERKDKIIGRVLDDFDDILAEDLNKFGPILLDRKDRFPLLQVADFVVYEMNHAIDNALHLGNPARPAIERLGMKPKILYAYHDRETLEHLPNLLETDREDLLAGRSNLDVWWPPSWHRTYKHKRKRRFVQDSWNRNRV